MYEALFYNRLENSAVQCQLCPQNCIILQGKRGKCRVRRNESGKLYSESFGKVSGYHFDPVEKKPLFHFYPGKQILSLGSYGCNLKCSFCQNFEISQAFERMNHFSLEPHRIVDDAKNHSNCCGISYTYNEPTVWIEYMLYISMIAKENGIVNAMVSNGFINKPPLEKVLETMDAFNIDLKAFTDDFYKEMCGGKLEPLKQTLKTIARSGKHLEIANLIIPGLNDDEKNFTEMAKWISNELGPDIPLHINRFHPAFRLQVEPTPVETLIKLRNIALKYLSYVYVGNAPTHHGESNTTCPKCNSLVVARMGYLTETKGLNDKGQCIKCGHKIVTI